MHIALRIAALLAVTYLIIVLLAWVLQDSLAWPAPRHILPDPATLGAPDGVRVTVTADDGIALHGWYLPPSPPPASGRAPALLWFTGAVAQASVTSPGRVRHIAQVTGDSQQPSDFGQRSQAYIQESLELARPSLAGTTHSACRLDNTTGRA